MVELKCINWTATRNDDHGSRQFTETSHQGMNINVPFVDVVINLNTY